VYTATIYDAMCVIQATPLGRRMYCMYCLNLPEETVLHASGLDEGVNQSTASLKLNAFY
jgi:hypothetical protein